MKTPSSKKQSGVMPSVSPEHNCKDLSAQRPSGNLSHMSAPKKLRGPKGRVITKRHSFLDSWNISAIYLPIDNLPAALIPCATAKAARQIVRLHAMSEEELVNAVIDGWCGASTLAKLEIKARAVLAALGLKGR